jgi:membrane protein DedA with SNARE-associated domain
VLVLAPIVVTTAAGTVGNAFFPALLRTHRLLLIALDARNRQLIPVAGRVGFVAYMVVSTVRRFVSDPSFYLLGRLYGDEAVDWLERRAGEAGMFIRSLERLFARIGPVLVFVFPGAIVCVLAGATAMSPVLFTVLNLAGTVVTVYLLWVLADVFKGPVGTFTNFVSDNYLWLTVLTVAITVLYLWDQHRRGKGGLDSLQDIDRPAADAGADEQPTTDAGTP